MRNTEVLAVAVAGCTLYLLDIEYEWTRTSPRQVHSRSQATRTPQAPRRPRLSRSRLPSSPSGLAGRDDASTTARDDGGLSLRSFGCGDLATWRLGVSANGCDDDLDDETTTAVLPSRSTDPRRVAGFPRPVPLPVAPETTADLLCQLSSCPRQSLLQLATTLSLEPIHSPSIPHDTTRSLHALASSGAADFENTLLPTRAELTPLALA
ncbi:hypothetical protein TCAP_04897 [Tolypocladium capitatum]|uniref:Uncharacterized protein n=1 Tax=Tolypocladium capitatum TaxID=45235 RepID=A0A2K3QC82_9HYPO|nr:hypothetical protein TCAP_04897 [Tolypocladium capitatum]